MATEPLKTIYLVRHGESEDNVRPFFQSYDSPLTERGQKQAKQIAHRVATLDFEALIASPQLRAKQTAEAIAKATHKTVELSDLFIERKKPTILEGKSFDDKEATDLWRRWEKTYDKSSEEHIMDSENFKEIVERAGKAFELLEARPEKNIVVVSHGLFIRTMVAHALVGPHIDGKTLHNFFQLMFIENTALSVFKFQPAFEEEARWRLWTYNDHAHFAE